MIRFATSTALLACLLPGQPSGKNASSTYRDNQFHFSFSYPAGYMDKANPVTQEQSRAQARKTGDPSFKYECTAAVLAATHPHGMLFDMVMIMKLDLPCANVKLTAAGLLSFSQGMVKKLLSGRGEAKFGESKTFDFGGHPALYLPATVDEAAIRPGQVLHAASVCTILDATSICWQLLSHDEATLKALSALPVTFDGKPSFPIVPAALLK